VEKFAGKYVPNQDSMFHGRISEPIPVWSRLYNGIWWKAQVDAGYTLSEETRRRLEAYKGLVGISDMVKKGVAPTAVGVKKEKVNKVNKVEEPAAAPVTKKNPKKVIAKAEVPQVEPAPVVKPAPAPVVEPAPAPVVKPEPAPVPKPKAKSKAKKAMDPIAIIDTAGPMLEVNKIIEIRVKKMEIEGRQVWVSVDKDKVYDLKYNYLGRYNRRENCIECQYPDSDKDA
jgi:hypothetical protein